MSDNANNLPGKILIVDADPSVPGALKEALSRYNVRVFGASDLESALYLFNQNLFEVVVVELEFSYMPGLALVQKWRAHEMQDKSLCGFIVASGNRNNKLSPGHSGLVRELGGIELIYKPYTPVQLLPYLSRGLALRKRNAAYQEVKGTLFSLASQPGKFDKALEVLQKKAPEIGPRANEMALELCENNNEFEKGVALVDQMLEKDPKNIALLNAKGRFLLKKGDFEKARHVMEAADKLAPKNIERINQMATMYLHLNEPQMSADKMMELIELNAENPEMKFDLFSRLYEFGFDEQAQSLCKATTDPMEVVRYYNNKGVALSKAGQVDAALAEYERSLQFYPKFRENYRILYNIALAHLSSKTRKSYEQADEVLLRCLTLKPDFEKALKARESVQKALGGAGAGAKSTKAS